MNNNNNHNNKEIFLKKYIEENNLEEIFLKNFNDYFEKINFGFQKLLNNLSLNLNFKKGKIELDEKITNGKKIEIFFSSNYSKNKKKTFILETPKIIRKFELEKDLFPEEAKIRNFFYSGKLIINFVIFVDGKKLKIEKINLGKIPIMIGSNFCNSIKRKKKINKGYFIIRGLTKNLISFEELRKNGKLFFEEENSFGIKIYSKGKTFSITNKIIFLKKKKEIFLESPIIKNKKINFFIYLSLVEKKSLYEIEEYLKKFNFSNLDYFLEAINNFKIFLKKEGKYEEIFQYFILEKKIYSQKDIIFLRNKGIFPHCGEEEKDLKNKNLTIFYFLEEILKKYKKKEVMDIDSLKYKSLKDPMQLYNDLLEKNIRDLFINLKFKLEKNFSSIDKLNIRKFIQTQFFYRKIKYAFSTGNWILGRKGVSQLTDMSNIYSILNGLRKVISELNENSSQNVGSREVHVSHIGRYCLLETPEGREIGLRKNLALFSKISKEINEKKILEKIFNSKFFFKVFKKEFINVFFNDSLIGFAKKEFINFFLEIKLKYFPEASISYNENKIEIYTFIGRILKPLLILKKGKVLFSLKEFEKLKEGKISFSYFEKFGYLEWVDCFEDDRTYVCDFPYKDKICNYCNNKVMISDEKIIFFGKKKLKKICENCKKNNLFYRKNLNDFSHLEISRYSFVGVSGLLVPYMENNYVIRGLLSAKMLKQTGTHKINSETLNNFLDVKLHSLEYSEKAIVKIFEDLILKEYYNGKNIVFSINTYEGYNGDDSLILKKSSLERGLFNMFSFRTYKTKINKYIYKKEKIQFPEENIFRKKDEKLYKKLMADGFPKLEETYLKDEIILGKISPYSFSKESESGYSLINLEIDNSIRNKYEGEIYELLISQNEEEENLIKINTLGKEKVLRGDKFSSRNGQKGVLGKIVSEENLFFNFEGISPDLIFNPQGLPSRATYSTLLENLNGKISSILGRFGNGQSFIGETEGEIRKNLRNNGYSDGGEEIFYNYLNGEEYDNDIFLGISYYYRLHHFVKEKIFSRRKGPIQMLTKQPTEGKIKGGGVRFGEMEKDCLVSYGAIETLKDRFKEKKIIQYVCDSKDCEGILLQSIKGSNFNECEYCKNKEIKLIEIPYSFKLLVEEFFALGILFIFNLEKKKEKNNLYEIKKINFRMVREEDILKISRLEIKTEKLYDNMGFPIKDGILDLKLGVFDSRKLCRSCLKFENSCTGHWGHLEFQIPVINFFFFKFLKKIINFICFNCIKVRLDEKKRKKILEKILENKIFSFSKIIKLVLKNLDETCPICKIKFEKIIFSNPFIFKRGKKKIFIQEIYDVFLKISMDKKEIIYLGFYNSKNKPKDFFIKIFPIPPNFIRPTIILEGSKRSENDLTFKLNEIVKSNFKIKSFFFDGSPELVIMDLYYLFEYHVSTYYNNNLIYYPKSQHRSGKILETLFQRIKGKEGRFRLNLTGKRTDFSSRTTIVPESNIKINEILIPNLISENLTLRKKINENNIEEIKKKIKNNKLDYLGDYVLKEIFIKNLETNSFDEFLIYDKNKEFILEKIKLGDIYERTLKNGDFILLNRQPSLHRMSILGFKIIIGREKCIGIPPMICSIFNADFDGDEMNIFLPRDEKAIIESKELIGVIKNIYSPKDKLPIIGAQQDFVIFPYILTNYEKKYSLEETFLLLKGIFLENEKWKKILEKKVEKNFFSGKEIFSFILPNITFKDDNKNLLIKDGILISGKINSKMVSLGKGILFKKIFEIFNKEEEKIIIFLDNYIKLCKNLSALIGFSFSLDEFSLPKEKKYLKILKKIIYFPNFKKKEKNKMLDIYQTLSFELGKNLKKIIIENKKKNRFFDLINSGSRGNLINLKSFIGSLGKQKLKFNLEEKIKKNKRMNPYCLNENFNLNMFGIITKNFFLGLDLKEIFYQINPSREGIVSKYIITGKVGYIQRKMTYSLEGLYIDEEGKIINKLGKIISFNFNQGKINFNWEEGTQIGNISAQCLNEVTTQINLNSVHQDKLEEGEKTGGIESLLNLIEFSEKIKQKNNLIEFNLLDKYLTNFKENLRILYEVKESFLGEIENKNKKINLIEDFKNKKYILIFHLDPNFLKSIGFSLNEFFLKYNGNIFKFLKEYGLEKINFFEKEKDCFLEFIFFKKFKFLSNLIRETIFNLGIKNIKLIEKKNLNFFFSGKINNLKEINYILNNKKIDINSIYLNNVLSYYEIFGIEKTRKYIRDELKRIYEQEGVKIDDSYLYLIADSMTHTGKLKKMNRFGIISDNSSPIFKAAFENGINVLIDAAINNKEDKLLGITENIIVGKTPFLGHERFNLIYNFLSNEN